MLCSFYQKNPKKFYQVLSFVSVLCVFLFTMIARDVVEILKNLSLKNEIIIALFVVTFIGISLYLVKHRYLLNFKIIFSLVILVSILGYILYNMEVPEERVHFLEFGFLALLFRKTFSFSYSAGRKYFFALGLSITVGIADEILQYYLPMRFFDVRDIAFNTLATVFAIVGYEIVFNQLNLYGVKKEENSN